MNIGKLLGGLSPGLSATGLFGHDAQSTGGAAMGFLSPILALLHHKHPGGAAAPQSPAVPGAPVPGAPAMGAPAMGAPAAPVAPAAAVDPHAKRRAAGLALLQLGNQFANPFGPRY